MTIKYSKILAYLCRLQKINANKIEIIHRRIRKSKKYGKVYGLAYKYTGKVELSNNHSSRRSYLNSLIHELLHILLPDFSETKISKITHQLTKHIWNAKVNGKERLIK